MFLIDVRDGMFMSDNPLTTLQYYATDNFSVSPSTSHSGDVFVMVLSSLYINIWLLKWRASEWRNGFYCHRFTHRFYHATHP